MHLPESLHWPFVRLRKPTLEQQSIGWLFLAATVVAGSSGTIFSKQLSSGGLSPMNLLFVSEALTLLFVSMSYGAVPLLRSLLHLQKRQAVAMVIIGMSSSFIGPIAWFTGLQYSNASNAELFSRMEAVFSITFAAIFLKEKLKTVHYTAAFTMLMGVLVVAFKGFTEVVNLETGEYLLLFSSFMYGIGTITFKKELSNLHPELVIFARCLFSVSLLLVVSFFSAHSLGEELDHLPRVLVPALIGYVVLSRFTSLFSFYQAMERLPVHIVSMSANLSMVFTLFLARFYLGERLELYHIAGAVLIVLGVVTLQTSGFHRDQDTLEKQLRQHPRNQV